VRPYLKKASKRKKQIHIEIQADPCITTIIAALLTKAKGINNPPK
jgi:hypothetical protein